MNDFQLLSKYLTYRIRMKCLNSFHHWYENAKKYPKGLGLDSGTYYPTNDVLSKSLEQGGMAHPILTFEQWKKTRETST